MTSTCGENTRLGKVWKKKKESGGKIKLDPNQARTGDFGVTRLRISSTL